LFIGKRDNRLEKKEVSNMFEVLVPRNNLVRELENFFDYALAPTPYVGYEAGEWMPATDVTETEKSYVVTMEIPGVDMNKLDISFQDGRLMIKGEKILASSEGETCLCGERFSGSFTRSFDIFEKVLSDKIDANYKDGILTVTLPKSEESIPKKIAIH
jgi:HSP20 family protein